MVLGASDACDPIKVLGVIYILCIIVAILIACCLVFVIIGCPLSFGDAAIDQVLSIWELCYSQGVFFNASPDI